MKKVTRYQCEFCGKEFRTPDRHECKKNPTLKNCFSCKLLRGWHEERYDTWIEIYPDCEKGMDGWTLEDIKSANYNMRCEFWEEEE